MTPLGGRQIRTANHICSIPFFPFSFIFINKLFGCIRFKVCRQTPNMINCGASYPATKRASSYFLNQPNFQTYTLEVFLSFFVHVKNFRNRPNLTSFRMRSACFLLVPCLLSLYDGGNKVQWTASELLTYEAIHSTKPPAIHSTNPPALILCVLDNCSYKGHKQMEEKCSLHCQQHGSLYINLFSATTCNHLHSLRHQRRPIQQ